jgi:thiol-disulfide isomerase/thioredoxin
VAVVSRKNILISISLIFFLSLGAAFFSGCTDRAKAAGPVKTASEKSGGREKGMDKDKKKVPTAEKIGIALRKGHPVFLYFYSDSIDDSLEQKPMVERVAKENGAEVFMIKAEDLPALRSSYEVNYVPTVFLIRPEAGLVDQWVVDMSESDLSRAIKAKINPNEKQKEVAQAIKDGKPQLMFFMAKWCGYCQATLPEVMKFKNSYSGCVRIVTVDVDEFPRMQDPYTIQGIPVILLTDGNGIFADRTGYPSDYNTFKKTFEDMGVDLKSCKTGAAKKTGDKT